MCGASRSDRPVRKAHEHPRRSKAPDGRAFRGGRARLRVNVLWGRNVLKRGVKRQAEELERGLVAAGDDVTRVEIVRRELRLGKMRVGGFAGFWIARAATRPPKAD